MEMAKGIDKENSTQNPPVDVKAARIAASTFNEWYATLRKWPGLDFWAMKAFPEWPRRIDNYYSIVYQSTKGTVSLDYLKMKTQEMTRTAREIIDAYQAAGCPEVKYDEVVDYAKAIFNAEEIPVDTINLTEGEHAFNAEGEKDF
jgi:hypothetical protein